MNYAELMNAVAAALKPRVEAAGGDVVLVATQEAARGMILGASPNRWKLILLWAGYAEHEASRSGMTVHQIATVIHCPQSLLANAGENLTKPAPSGAVPFSTRIEQVTGWMTGMRFPDGTNADPYGFSLSGSDWVDASKTSTAHVLNWQLDAALSRPTEEFLLNFPDLTPNNP